MKVRFVINNYQKGAIVRMTPTHKLFYMTQLDRNHHELIYVDLTEREIQLCEKAFGKKREIVEMEI